ncbi:MAG: fibronectin type III domain-containing protein, partial [Deltaproteobacteria bacterium]|nr:fibronectin type III domain-containing protein [Deltaproteobacteria bacterium]
MKTKHTQYFGINSPIIRRFFTFTALISVLLLFPVVGFGADVTVAWDANSEGDLAGYIVYWGTTSGDYSDSKDVGITTQHTITGLQDGVKYYFAATAYDHDKYESGYSQELFHVAGSQNLTSHTITASAGSNGSISPSGAVTVANGTSQAFSISANQNYKIMDVMVDGVSVGAVASHSFNNVTDDHMITVSFVALNVDSDGDGVPDDQDEFPLDPNETADTDRDGEGNNTDTDDDNDGMPDDWELAYGLDPLKDDAAGDLDGDEVSNINEYNLGTKPDYHEGNFK